MEDIYCYSFVEDQPSAEVLRKMVNARNDQCDSSIIFRNGFPSIMGGYSQIEKKASAFLEMASGGQYTLILTDLDKEVCPPELIRKWFFPNSENSKLPKEIIFRIAVREVESWILADRSAFARFMGIPVANFTVSPDEEPDPKEYLFSLIRKKGPRRWQKEMLPRKNSSIGPMYNEKICEFIISKWSPERAAKNSPSLRRALVSLYDL